MEKKQVPRYSSNSSGPVGPRSFHDEAAGGGVVKYGPCAAMLPRFRYIAAQPDVTINPGGGLLSGLFDELGMEHISLWYITLILQENN